MRLLFKDSLNLNAFSSLTWVWVISVLTTLTKGVRAVFRSLVKTSLYLILNNLLFS